MSAFKVNEVSLWKRIVQYVKTGVYLGFTLLIISVFIPICAVISYMLWLIALLVSLFDPTLGRFVTSLDAWMDEDFTDNLPRSSIVTTMQLEGSLTLEQLKSLFNTNVLQALLSKDCSKTRYPELQQYLTKFLGFRVWKKDATFNIDNHIFLRFHDGPVDPSVLHHEMMNKPYNKSHSPWEIMLVNCASPDGVINSVVAARLHHSMADGKSILKLLVECLGQKPLKTAQAVKSTTSYLQAFIFYLLFPLHYVQLMVFVFYKFCTSHSHPWKTHSFRGDTHASINVAFSPQLKLDDLKLVAKTKKVTSSAVVMALVAGSIRKCGVDFEDRDVIMGYPLPKEDHPESMANHVYMGIMPLPTNQSSRIKRLDKCNTIFLHAKATQLGKYTNVTALQSGTLIHPLAKRLAVNHFVPMFLTNIAGDQEGFSVGERPCQDFRMSVGTLDGVAGVIFCAFSYKDSMYVGITAKESVMSKVKTEELAKNIGLELKLLTTI